jgi:predicted DNA-binding transcriptional regulator AlpA
MPAKKKVIRHRLVPLDHEPSPVKLIRIRELCTLFGVDRCTIYHWRKNKILPPPIKIGSTKAWTEAQIARFLAERAEASGAAR